MPIDKYPRLGFDYHRFGDQDLNGVNSASPFEQDRQDVVGAALGLDIVRPFNSHIGLLFSPWLRLGRLSGYDLREINTEDGPSDFPMYVTAEGGADLALAGVLGVNWSFNEYIRLAGGLYAMGMTGPLFREGEDTVETNISENGGAVLEGDTLTPRATLGLGRPLGAWELGLQLGGETEWVQGALWMGRGRQSYREESEFQEDGNRWTGGVSVGPSSYVLKKGWEGVKKLFEKEEAVAASAPPDAAARAIVPEPCPQCDLAPIIQGLKADFDSLLDNDEENPFNPLLTAENPTSDEILRAHAQALDLVIGQYGKAGEPRYAIDSFPQLPLWFRTDKGRGGDYDWEKIAANKGKILDVGSSVALPALTTLNGILPEIPEETPVTLMTMADISKLSIWSTLQNMKAWLEKDPDAQFTFTIGASTDFDEAYNRELAQARALAFAKFLSTVLDLPEERVRARDLGEAMYTHGGHPASDERYPKDRVGNMQKADDKKGFVGLDSEESRARYVQIYSEVAERLPYVSETPGTTKAYRTSLATAIEEALLRNYSPEEAEKRFEKLAGALQASDFIQDSTGPTITDALLRDEGFQSWKGERQGTAQLYIAYLMTDIFKDQRVRNDEKTKIPE